MAISWREGRYFLGELPNFDLKVMHVALILHSASNQLVCQNSSAKKSTIRSLAQHDLYPAAADFHWSFCQRKMRG